MKIAVHAQELEAQRIDGTRNYIARILRVWQNEGDFSHDVSLYHKRRDLNPAFGVMEGDCLREVQLDSSLLWTQANFARALWRDCPDVLWMPIHNLPLIHKRNLRTVVTIHDLAFLKFPESFPVVDVLKHKIQTAHALKRANHIIAVSESTKKDILTSYPNVKSDQITVIHHGINVDDWGRATADEILTVQKKWGIDRPYFLYVGAIQPRKNLVRLVKAFDDLRSQGYQAQLVLAGGDAWLSKPTHDAIAASVYSDDIVWTDGLSDADMKCLLSGATALTYPSLYEGFGMPILEAFASSTAVITADNSSLREVGGNAALYCDALDMGSISKALIRVLTKDSLRESLVSAGLQRVTKFTWNQAAKKTIGVLSADFPT